MNSGRQTKAFTAYDAHIINHPGVEKIGVNCLSQKATACFTSASGANLFAIQVLLQGSKEMGII
jgi:hypothetical protein